MVKKQTQKKDNKKRRKILLATLIPVGAAVAATAITVPLVMNRNKGEDAPIPVSVKAVGFTNTSSTPAKVTLNYANYVEGVTYWEISYDGKTWEDAPDGTETEEIAQNKTLYVRGKGFSEHQKAVFDYDQGKYIQLTEGSWNLSGNINRLVDYEKTDDEIAYVDNMFNYGFLYSTAIKSVPSDFLPAKTLSKGCYLGMFCGCSGLTTAPNLPAETLAVDCYCQMFVGTGLITAPELKSTNLADACYYEMFSACTSLTTAPNLPAIELKAQCYYWMFYGCTSLTSAPTLPATTLAEYCYQDMFNGCTSLTTAPSLPAKALTKYCYDGMFYGCTSLTTAPSLQATKLDEYCCRNMFNGCTSLTTAPSLQATTLAKCCYLQMFKRCSKLKISENETTGTIIFICPDTTGLVATDEMFAETGGSFTTGTPTANNTYYWY